MTLSVLTAADGASWEARLLSELGPAGAFTVSRRCVDVVELLAVAATGQASAALVDVRLRRLDTDAVDRLAAAGVAVVGIVAPGSDADVDLLRTRGVTFSAPSDAGVDVIATVLNAAVGDLSGVDTGSSTRTFSDPAAATGSVHRPVLDPAPVLDDAPRGSVIAVWGPAGAPGRTTVAAALADEIARLGISSMLVDADVYGGVAASVFGLLDESPGLVAACRQAQSRRLDPSALAALCWQISPKLRVLTGISRADRWPELRANAVENVLAVARETVEFTIVDLGFCLETDEELSFDTVAPRRNGATLAALDGADLVIVVGSADPIGMQRLIRGLDELQTAEIDQPRWIVLNRVRRSAVPGNPDNELDAALNRFAGVTAAAQLPYDRDAVDRAVVAGRTLAEAAPNSPLRRGMSELAAAIAGVPAPRPGRRRR